MKRFLILALMALPLFAGQADPLFVRYEATRQALLKDSLPAVKTAAKDLATAAKSAKQPALAALAANVEKAADLKAARTAFAALSEEAIKYRAASKGDKPSVAYCSMHKASWLQPAGEIGNPYADASMRKCGELK